MKCFKTLERAGKQRACLLSFPDGWEYNRDHIVSLSTDGRTVWENAIKELIILGYVSRHKVRLENGRFSYDYLISDSYIPMHVCEQFAKTGRL